ncbi:hypothetical protein SPI_01334 [Niveomyces insectorum RCEF 264]|uniref:LYC1 C-terminal domain-containing protein n=1 Tax=Niveomyces insectorum RCEF 264 TaxID=1081102 RepID=A0A167YVX3_9HYPO|nr:hypothetical protein SPI_01334 [Niveomyces insectorum RCEF 264]
MGSNHHNGDPLPLPDAASPFLVLVAPTPGERRRVWALTHTMWGVWALTHTMWGSALAAADYVAREAYLTTVPLAREGGIAHWILTEPYRGRGYAGRMLRELGARLADQAGTTNDQPSLFSVLYSDIGKTYYANKGWAPFSSSHLSFPPAKEAASAAIQGPVATPLGYHELAELCPVDERLLQERLVRRVAARAAAAAAKTAKTATAVGPSVALVPDLNTMLWHLMREDYMTKHIFGLTPTVRGALCCTRPSETATAGAVPAAGNNDDDGHRMWMVWTRGYYGGSETTEGNTLHILRVVLEDLYDDGADADADAAETEKVVTQRHVDAFAALVRLAQAEAAAWMCGSVQLWNPTPAQAVLARRSGLAYEVVDREEESIASLRWNGGGDGGSDATRVDWVANEKFGWF